MVYAGLDPATGRERRRWHAARADRADAERLARQLARLAASPRVPRDHHRRRKAWTAEELGAFLEAIRDRPYRRWIWLAAHTGMRRGELIGLRWRDVELDKARLSIVRTVICVGARMQEAGGKTPNAARILDLDAATVELLADWRVEHAEQFGDDDANR